MFKSTALVAAMTLVWAGLSVAPSVAASGGVPFCVQPRSDKAQHQALDELSQRLRLSTKTGSTIEYWNGCLKVSYTDDNGHNTVDFYDPDSYRQVGTLG